MLLNNGAMVSGEDLTPYRHASRAVLSVLSRFGIVEKGALRHE